MASSRRKRTPPQNQHVTPHPRGWAVGTAGKSKPGKVVPTQAEAAAIARQRAIRRQSELFIHGRNGRIRLRNSYGSDPRHIPG